MRSENRKNKSLTFRYHLDRQNGLWPCVLPDSSLLCGTMFNDDTEIFLGGGQEGHKNMEKPCKFI